ncbi:MAG: metallophosphoesterase [Clostridia bacterium]|nr:metallophosphoesterase [Clostridia bacterium]
MIFPGDTSYVGRHAGEYVRRPSHFLLFLRVLAVLAVIALLAWPFVEPYCLQVERVTVRSADFPAAIGQLRVIYVSDIHAGSTFGQGRVEELVQQINRLNPDLVLLGGDYAADSAGAIEFFRHLPEIHARCGVYAVMGNHDRTVPESNLALLRQAMQQAGVTPLVNEVTSVRVGNAAIWLAGLDDLNNGHPDLNALARRVRRDDYVILLCHSPAVIPDAINARDMDFQLGWFDLGLFGHTHGGQIGLFGGIVRDKTVPEAYRSGWNRVNRIDLLTSNGVGTTGLPVRLLCRPQLHVITITTDN